MRLFLGVDGGQSGTVALIGNEEGSVVGIGRAGPCNHASAAEGRARFRAAIGGSVQSALDRISLADVTFQSACLGFSGGPADKDALTRELVKAARYTITHDAWIALAGATAGEPGIIAIAGTGSMAFGKNREGRTARAGGWGYAFGDEGSAFDLVRQALRAVLRAEEGWGPRTVLRDLLLEADCSSGGAADANSLLHLFYSDEYPRPRVASFAPLVDQAAVLGDPAAQDILKHAAQSLATFVAAVRGQLFEPPEAVAVSYTGGVFKSQILFERFRMLVELENGNRLTPPRYGPAAGALLEAYRAAGVACALKEVPEEKGAFS
jgi:N-acetylglucosamine kinase-like BadF-type ATPase